MPSLERAFFYCSKKAFVGNPLSLFLSPFSSSFLSVLPLLPVVVSLFALAASRSIFPVQFLPLTSQKAHFPSPLLLNFTRPSHLLLNLTLLTNHALLYRILHLDFSGIDCVGQTTLPSSPSLFFRFRLCLDLRSKIIKYRRIR